MRALETGTAKVAPATDLPRMKTFRLPFLSLVFCIPPLCAEPPEDECCGGSPGHVASDAAPQRPSVPVDRPIPAGTVTGTLPVVEAPREALESSSMLTVEEFSRRRLLQGAPVPGGGKPSDTENVAPVAAMRGYAARTAPDVFANLGNFLAKHSSSAFHAALLAHLGSEACRA